MRRFLLFATCLLLSIYTSAQTAPVASPDTIITIEDTPATFSVTANDTDVNGNINVSTVDLNPALAGIQSTFIVSGEGAYQTNGLGGVTFTPVLNYNGTATPVNYTVSDSLGAVSNISAINITVTAVNDAPSFTKGLNQTVCENSLAQTVSNWATALSAGPINESSQLLSFTATNNNNTLFTVQPAINATGNLTYTPALNQNGSATITVHINDNGGIANGGVDKSADQTFSITINPLPVPTFTASAGITTCVGTDVTYTTQSGGGITNYIWSVPGSLGTDYNITSGGIGTSSNTVTLKWLTAGSKTVTVNYSNSSSCAGLTPATSTTTVSALPVPTFTASAGINTCVGTDVTYTTQSGGGITNYIWSVFGILGTDYSITSGNIGTTSNTVTLKWLTAGSKTVTVNYSNSSSCAGLTPATSTTTAAALPVPTFTASSGLTTCVGTDVTYTTQSGGGINTYIWSVPGILGTDYSITSGNIGTTSNTVTLKWLTAGSKTVTVNYSNSSSCAGLTPATSTTTAAALPVPTFTASAGITTCVGTDVTYTTQSDGGITNYVWSVPGILGTDYSITSGSIGISSNTVTLKWLTAGSKTVTVNYSNSSSCAGLTPATSTTTAAALPVPTFTASAGITTCVGTDVTYTTQGGGGINNYIWSVPGSLGTDYNITSGGIGTLSNTVTLKWLTAGSKTVTVNYNNSGSCAGLTPATSTTTVSALPVPTFTVSAGTTTCVSTDVTYTTQSGGGINNYIWSVPGSLGTDYNITSGGIGTSSNTVTLKWLTAGSKTVTVNYSNSGSCAGLTPATSTTTVSALPTIYNVTGGGSYCLGGSGVAIGLSGSQSGVTYQLYSGASPVGSSVAGTGSAISFGNQTTAGTNYNVIATNTLSTCTQTMSGSATVGINALPVPTFTASAGLTTCLGTDVTYTAQSGGGITNYIWSVPGSLGTDYSITSGGIGTTSNTVTIKWLTAGSKTVTVNYSNSTGCNGAIPATSTTTAVALPVPTFTVSAGITSCVGTDVTYTTQSGGGITNYIWNVPGTFGTDYSITSGGIGTSSNTVTLKWLTAGTKSVTVNYSNSNACAGAIAATNTTTVSVLPVPTFTVSAGSTTCAGTNVTYSTQSGGGITNYVWSIPGTLGLDYSITSGGIGTSSNTVTLKWLTVGSKIVTVNYSNSSGCQGITAATNATTVAALPVPTFTVSAGTTTCVGTDVTYTTQSGGGINNYIWSVPGSFGTDYSITSGGIGTTSNTVTLKWLTAGNKTVTVNYNNLSGCSGAIGATNTTTVSALPIIYNVTGGGSYCSGGSGVSIGLSGSQTGVTYQLYSGVSPVGSSVAGTGSAISFDNQTTAGTNYNVIATNTSSTCTQNMNGSVAVTVNPLPTLPAVSTSTPSNICPLKTVDLTLLLTSPTPIGGAILYKTTNNPLGISVPDPTKVGAGTYYIFYQNSSGCYSSSIAVTVTVNNCSPIANSAMNTTIPSTAIATAISALTATDTDGTITGYTVLTLPLYGALYVGGVAITAGQVLTPIQVASLTYDPSGSFIGNDSFTFTATDNNNAVSNTATFIIPVGNNPPVANSATNATIPSTGGATVISALTATDTDGTIAGYTILTLPTHGTLYVGGIAVSAAQVLTLAQATTLTYDPSGTFTGNDTFTFTATDNSGATDPSAATITIPVGNNPPAANSATNATIPSSAGATAISALTATDTDGTIAGYTILTLPTRGTLYVGGVPATTVQVLSISQAATLTYDPNGTFTGNDIFTFTATDNNGGVSSPATITIPVGNNPPVANSVTNAAIPSVAGATAISALTATDTDGTITSYKVLTLPLYGTLYVGGVAMTAGQVLTSIQTGALTYDPNGSFIGNDSFTFTATDNNNAVSNTATITIPIGNNSPIANSATNAIIPSTAGPTAITALTATDTDGTIAGYTILTLPSRGTLYVGGLAVTAGQILTPVQVTTLTYDPSGTFTGNETFTFTATDNSGASDPGPATITIPVGNNPPVANSATNATIPSTAGSTAISALTATDTDGTISGYTILALPSHGTLYVGGVAATALQTLSLSQAASLSYDPTGTFTGNETFTFTAADNNGGVSSPATITIPVGNNLPVANSATNAAIPSVAGATAISALTATDADGTITGYTVLTLPLQGTLYVGGIAMNAGQVLTTAQAATITYDPSGTFTGNDTFTFTATDNNNAVSNTATITIPVANNSPVANSATNAIIPSTAVATAIPALTATDTDGTIIGYKVLTLPSRGILYVGGIAVTIGQVLSPVQVTTLTYDPSGTFTGNDIFTFTATDNSGASDSSPATITIPIGNNLPVANSTTNGSIPSTAGATAISALTATDTDGTITGYTILTLPSRGTLYVGGVAATTVQFLSPSQAASLTYDPNGTFTGNDTFTFTATDNNGGVSSPATITIPVVNNPPVANSATNASIPSTAGATAISALTATDTDGAITGYTVLTLPTKGTLYVGGVAITAGQVLTAIQVALITYDPNGTFTGNDTFTFTATDNNNAVSNTATITIPVGNNPPLANNAASTTIPSTAGATAIPALTATDTDGTITGYTVLTLPAHGTLFVGGITVSAGQVLTLAQATTLTYDPNGSFIGNDSFTFTARDNNNAVSNTATFTIPVGNNPPVANSATNATIPSTAGLTAISALTATDSDGTITSYTVLMLPAHGTLFIGGIAATAGQVLAPAQVATLTYDPNGVFTGNDTFSFTVTDNIGATDPSPATITIPVGNNLPVANSATTATIPSSAGATAISALSGADTDGTITGYTILTLPLQGTLSVGNVPVITGQILTPAQAAAITYDPTGTFTGNDSFTFKAIDNNGGESVTATITIPVGNNPPLANSATTAAIPSVAGATAISALTATDTDGTISGYTVLSLPARGILFVGGVAASAGQVITTVQAATLTYDPSGTFTGNDTFTFTAIDNSNAVSNTATITISVGNNPPVANNATTATIISIAGATAISALTATDTDGTITSYTVLTLALHGTLSAGGTAITSGQVLTPAQAAAITYDPNGTFIGNEAFTFLATDNSSSVSNTATITIPVGNNPPVAISATNATVPSTAAATALAALTATDTDGTIVSYTILTLTTQGTLSVSGIALISGDVLTPAQAAAITYLPNGVFSGNDSFIFTATDNSGAIDTTPATIIIPVGNNQPVANPDTVATNEDTPVSFNVIANDIDTDGTINGSTVDLDPVTAGRQTTFIVTGQGTYSVNNSGVVTFTPALNYNGAATAVNYTVNDNKGTTSTIAAISVTVTPVNDPPVANPDTKTTTENTPVAFNVTANDTDIDGTVDVSTVDLNPSTAGRQTTFVVTGQGTYTVDNSGIVTFVPATDFYGTAAPVNYTVNDNNWGVSNISTLTLTVTALNFAPVPVDDNAIASQNVSVTIAVLNNDSFGINGPSTGSISATNGSRGAVRVDNGGTPGNPTDDKIIYSPNSGFIGSDIFSYTICNSKGSCSSANVRVTINPLSDILILNMRSTNPVMNPDGVTFKWFYIITLINKQSQPVDSIRIIDDLNKVFDVIPKPTFTVAKVSSSGNTLIVNNAYNGTTDINLLSNRSYLNANSSDSITLEVNSNPAGYIGELLNTAYLDGLLAVGTIKGAPSDEATTVLPNVDLTVPEGFTPNGDGYNDKFVIVHSNLVKMKLLIFNRWGNQVYSSNDYQNTWDGKSPGGNDLPAGTYFLEIYVIENPTGSIIKREMRSITLIR